MICSNKILTWLSLYSFYIASHFSHCSHTGSSWHSLHTIKLPPRKFFLHILVHLFLSYIKGSAQIFSLQRRLISLSVFAQLFFVIFICVFFLPLMYLVKIILFIDMLFNKKKIYPVKYKPHEIREFYYIFHCYIPQIKRVVDSWEILVKSIKYLSDFIIKKLNMNAFF